MVEGFKPKNHATKMIETEFSEAWSALKQEAEFLPLMGFLSLHRNRAGTLGSTDITRLQSFVQPALWGPWAAVFAAGIVDIGNIVEPGHLSLRFKRIYKIHAISRPGGAAGRALEDEADQMMNLFIEVVRPFLLALWCGVGGEELYLSTMRSIARARARCEVSFRGSLTTADLARQRRKEDRNILFGRRSASSSSTSDDDEPTTKKAAPKKATSGPINVEEDDDGEAQVVPPKAVAKKHTRAVRRAILKAAGGPVRVEGGPAKTKNGPEDEEADEQFDHFGGDPDAKDKNVDDDSKEKPAARPPPAPRKRAPAKTPAKRKPTPFTRLGAKKKPAAAAKKGPPKVIFKKNKGGKGGK
jgi:hypothetical protein